MNHRSTHWLVSAFALTTLAAGTVAAPLPRRGLMGIMIAPLNEQMQKQLGLESAEGVLVNGIRPDSPAADAKLQQNDVIVRIGDAKCSSIPDLQRLMRGYIAGDTIKMAVMREGKKVTADLTLIERPRETSDQYDVLYDSAGPEGRRVRTIITRPKEAEKSPAVLFIQGLAPQTVDVGLMPRHPYNSLIQGLDEAGFVTMRVDRLGVGDSEGVDVKVTTVKDDVRSFREALEKLGTYVFVDPARVFVLSHSSGGAIAPMVAAGSNVRGVITWAAFANPVADVVMELTKQRWKLEVREEEEIKKNTPLLETFVTQCMVRGQSPADVFRSHPAVEAVARPMLQRGDEDIVLGAPYTYWHQLASLDLPNEWSRVDTNVLALWGGSDFNALRRCSELIAATVNKMHEGKGTFTVVEGVDHMWQPAEDMEESFLMGFTGDFSPKVIQAISEWTKKVGS